MGCGLAFAPRSRLRRLGADGRRAIPSRAARRLRRPAGPAGEPARAASSRHSGHYNRPSSYAPPGPAHDPWGPWVRDASRRFDVPERWIREVMRQESGGRVSATSPVGAMGLMQVMPGTYAELRSRYGLGDDPYHPYDSIMAGTAYIREMYELVWLAGLPRRLQRRPAAAGGLSLEQPRPAGRDPQLRLPHRPQHHGPPPEPPRGARDLRRRRDPALHPGRPAPHGHRDHAGAPLAARRAAARHPGGAAPARPNCPNGPDPRRLHLRRRDRRAAAAGPTRSRSKRRRPPPPAQLSEWTRSPTAPPTPNSAPPPARHAPPEPRLAPTTARTAAVLANVNAPPPQQSSGGGAAASG